MRPQLVKSLNGRPMAVSTRALTKSFGSQVALDRVDLTVPEGSIYVLVGPNGAGKSTTLNALVDLVRPDSGGIEVLGRSASEAGPAVRAEIGYVPETTDFGYGKLTARELIDHHSRYFAAWDAAYAEQLGADLEVVYDKRFGKLSKGQARRVQLVMALAHRPRLLLLDEPTDGLDPLGRDRVLEILADHAASSPTTILVSTHVIHELEGLGDCLGALRDGRLIAQLERDDLGDHLHRVRAEAAEGWTPSSDLVEQSLVRKASGRELDWVIWGDAEALPSRFAHEGAEVRDVARLNLEQATRAILRMEVN